MISCNDAGELTKSSSKDGTDAVAGGWGRSSTAPGVGVESVSGMIWEDEAEDDSATWLTVLVPVVFVCRKLAAVLLVPVLPLATEPMGCDPAADKLGDRRSG
jgi:hypothetical protein